MTERFISFGAGLSTFFATGLAPEMLTGWERLGAAGLFAFAAYKTMQLYNKSQEDRIREKDERIAILENRILALENKEKAAESRSTG